jgi:hypothetical protein
MQLVANVFFPFSWILAQQSHWTCQYIFDVVLVKMYCDEIALNRGVVKNNIRAKLIYFNQQNVSHSELNMINCWGETWVLIVSDILKQLQIIQQQSLLKVKCFASAKKIIIICFKTKIMDYNFLLKNAELYNSYKLVHFYRMIFKPQSRTFPSFWWMCRISS